MKQLSIDEFLDRLRDMPDIEAEMELVLRKERQAAEHAVITNARAELEANGKKGDEWRRLGQEISVMMQDSTLINEALKACRKRQESIAWPRAVRAIFGDEGYTQCRVWMATQGLTNPSAMGRPTKPPEDKMVAYSIRLTPEQIVRLKLLTLDRLRAWIDKAKVRE